MDLIKHSKDTTDTAGSVSVQSWPLHLLSMLVLPPTSVPSPRLHFKVALKTQLFTAYYQRRSKMLDLLCYYFDSL